MCAILIFIYYFPEDVKCVFTVKNTDITLNLFNHISCFNKISDINSLDIFGESKGASILFKLLWYIISRVWTYGRIYNIVL